MKSFSSTAQLKSERLRRHLVNHPDEAQKFATLYYEQLLSLASQYQVLEAENNQLKSKLTEANSPKPLSLPSFLKRQTNKIP